jgi:hypothetical protein
MRLIILDPFDEMFEPMKTYRLSASGRRTTLVLLIGALLIWAFAIWTLRSSLATVGSEPLTIGQIIPALLMVVLIIATPLVVWNLLEEWSSAFTPSEAGLRFTANGVDLIYPWSGLQAIRATDDDNDEPMHELIWDRDYTSAIRNPLIRFLHGQAYGRTKLPLYAGIADRQELVQTIRQYSNLAEDVPQVNSEANTIVS